MIRVLKAFSLVLVLMIALLVPTSFALANGQGNGKGTAPVSAGANTPGPYDPANVGQGDNQGNGKAPDNGTVGNADGKNPPGQVGNDKDSGYECDDNKGVGNNGGNPAHSGCTSPTPTPTATKSVSPSPSVSPSKSPKPTPSVSVTPSASVSPSPLCDAYSGGCVTPPVVKPSDPPKNEKVTICHATGSKKNPYVIITVDKNGLNGHGQHEKDIVPAPKHGCLPYRDIARPCPSGIPTPSPAVKRDRLCSTDPLPSVSPAPPIAVFDSETPKPTPPVVVGPVVPEKVVPNTVSDSATATVDELPRTGANSTALMAYVAIMLLGIGTLCYTLPVALTRVR